MAQETEQERLHDEHDHVHGDIRIHLDRHPCTSPNPTSGSALYVLAGVAVDHDLFREVNGNHEDELIPNDGAKVHLKEDEHFYTAERLNKILTIIVNGRKKIVTERKLAFSQLVALAFEAPPTGENVVFTVTYRCGDGSNQGTLTHGESVEIKNGMIFNVTATDKS